MNYRKIAVSQLLIFLVMMKSAFPQDLPTIQMIKSNIDLNNKKISDGKYKFLKVTVRDVGYFDSGGKDKDYVEKHNISGKVILYFNSSTVFSESKEVTAFSKVNVERDRVIRNSSILWIDREKKIQTAYVDTSEGVKPDDTVEQENNGDSYVSVGKSNFASNLPDVFVGPEAPSITEDYVCVGKINFKSLPCLDLRWESKDKSSTDRMIICPSRDYRIIFEESINTASLDGVKTEVVSTSTVEKMENRGEVWFPTQVRRELVKRIDGKTPLTSVSKTVITDFLPNSLSSDAVFDPIFIPGATVLDRSGGRLKHDVTGGDPSTLLNQLSLGDFSFLDESQKDVE